MEATKKSSHIFARSKTNKNAQYSPIEQQTGSALQEIISQLDGDNKKYGSSIEINKVIEIPNGKEKPATLIYLTHRGNKVLLTALYKKFVT